MVVTAILFIIVTAGALVYLSYRRDIQNAYRRLERREREVAETACGRIEYAVRGDGYPVLMVHGSAGGFDQALDLAAEHVAAGFQVVAPSRAGYLGTPLPEGASPASEAHALVCLLDELEIEEAAVMAYSAGGPAAVQMALRYPERVSSLVLVSTAIADKPLALPPRPVIQSIFGSDFAFWLLVNPFRSLTQRMFVPASYQMTPAEEAEVAETVQALLPVAPRSEGLLFDMFVTNTDLHEHSDQYELEALAVPVLVVNARDDPAANYADAVAMSERIPRARLLTVEEGGHMMLGNGDIVARAITRFLEEERHPAVSR